MSVEAIIHTDRPAGELALLVIKVEDREVVRHYVSLAEVEALRSFTQKKQEEAVPKRRKKNGTSLKASVQEAIQGVFANYTDPGFLEDLIEEKVRAHVEKAVDDALGVSFGRLSCDSPILQVLKPRIEQRAREIALEIDISLSKEQVQAIKDEIQERLDDGIYEEVMAHIFDAETQITQQIEEFIDNVVEREMDRE